MNKMYVRKPENSNRPLSEDEQKKLDEYRAGDARRELEKYQKIDQENKSQIERQKYQPPKRPDESEGLSTVKKILTVILSVIVLTLWTNSCEDDKLAAQAAQLAKIKCIAKGVEYYKAIGSYPTLSTGRSADVLINGLCSRSTDAFDGFLK